MLEMRDRIDDSARAAKGIADRVAEQVRGATQAAGDRAKEVTSGMVEAVKDKVHDVAAGASELVGNATDKAQDWASSVGDAAVQATDRAQHMASATVENVGDLAKDVTALVRRYPLPALLLGIGAGFLLAQVLHQSSSKRA